MDRIITRYVRLTEGRIGRITARVTRGNGQTMTEYALILAAVAVAVLAGYQTMGTKLNSTLTSVDNTL